MSGDVPTAMLGRSSFLLGKLHAALIAIESEQLGSVGLDIKQHSVLTVLVDEGAMTQQGIGQRLGIDRTTVVTVVDGLDESGLVERRRSTTDRRSYLLIPTRAGRQAQKRGQRVVRAAERQLFAALDESEQQMLVQLMGRALDGVVRSDGMPGRV